jgi:hypothetical protein
LPAKLSFSDFTGAIAAGDLDGDRRADAVLGIARSSGQHRLALLRNVGSGVLVDDSQRIPFTVDRDVTRLALGDLDGDGDLDLVAAVWQRISRIFRNDGTGRFSEPNPSALSQANWSDVRLFDVDRDGDLDLLFACGFDGSPRLFLNDRLGNFTEAGATQMPQVRGNRLEIGDLDGDGDTDFVLAEVNGRNHVLVNDGRGTFTDESAARLPLTMDESWAVGLADVDGDRDLDLVFGNRRQNQDRLYLNDGRGFFTDVTSTHMPLDQEAAGGLAFGDLDGDGHPDLVIGNEVQSRILLNDGTGRFTDVTASRLADVVTRTRAVALADFSGSGALDIFFGGAATDLLCVNRLHSIAGPLLPRVGGAYDFDFYVRPGFASGGETVLAYLSAKLSSASIPVPPFGSWGLDPGAMLVLARIAIPAPRGSASLRVTIPADTGLVGARFFAQGIVFEPPGATPWRITNVLAEQILR